MVTIFKEAKFKVKSQKRKQKSMVKRLTTKEVQRPKEKHAKTIKIRKIIKIRSNKQITQGN